MKFLSIKLTSDFGIPFRHFRPYKLPALIIQQFQMMGFFLSCVTLLGRFRLKLEINKYGMFQSCIHNTNGNEQFFFYLFYSIITKFDNFPWLIKV